MAIKLIVGLGNPGQKYLETRHNAGFWFIDELMREHILSLSSSSKYKGDSADFVYQGDKRFLLKPSTFMNSSGESVGAFCNYFKIKADEVLVAHDELDLPAGTIRLKKGGGHGGHNGLRSIIAHFSSKDFWRLRIGIGHPGDKNKVIDYVLGRISRDDHIAVEQALVSVMANMEKLYRGEFDPFMHAVHSQVKNR